MNNPNQPISTAKPRPDMNLPKPATDPGAAVFHGDSSPSMAAGVSLRRLPTKAEQAEEALAGKPVTIQIKGTANGQGVLVDPDVQVEDQPATFHTLSGRG